MISSTPPENEESRSRAGDPSARPAVKRRRPLKQKLMLLVGSVIVGLLLCEGLLRLAGISYPQLYTPDPYCASRLRAGTSGWWISEGRAFVEINSDSLRDTEHSRTKRPGTVRVAVLGDSFSEALQVDLRDTFWSVAERVLNSVEPELPDVEFINFGVAGYGTAQELLMLRHYVWDYDPDIVLLVFCHNDLTDNSRDSGGGDTRPYFVLNDGQLQIDNSFRESDAYVTASSSYEQFKAKLVNQVYLLQVLKRAKLNWHERDARSQAATRGVSDIGSKFNVYQPPGSESEKAAWQITERLVAEFSADVRARQKLFGLVTVTAPLQVYPDPRVRSDAAGAAESWDDFYSENRLTVLAGETGFPILTLAGLLQPVAEAEGVFFHGFANTAPGTGHWNQAGHLAAGQHLAHWLAEELLPQAIRSDR